MRISALLGLMVVSIAAACGDSSDKGDDDKKKDAGTKQEEDLGELPDIDDGELSGCDKGDPCCFGSDEYDYTRCMELDGGTAAAN